jgi:hypothetical protein
MNKYRVVLLLLLFISYSTEAANTTTQIGNSYFQKPQKKAADQKLHVITQVGAAMEEHQTLDVFYLFLNQMFPNHIYYELRAYGIYNYITQNPPAPPIVPEPIPVSSERHQIGYGGVGILGYNIPINPNVSFMPFIRLQDITNSVAVYKDTLGNEIDSDNYTAFLGGKLSLRVNKVFAIYAQYFAGHQRSVLSGHGVFSNAHHPVIKAFVSTFELGAPYKMTKSWSVTPYIQFLRTNGNPDFYARRSPYNISSLSNNSNVYAIKLGYEF